MSAAWRCATRASQARVFAGGRQRAATSRSTKTSWVRSSARSEQPVRYARVRATPRAGRGRRRRSRGRDRPGGRDRAAAPGRDSSERARTPTQPRHRERPPRSCLTARDCVTRTPEAWTRSREKLPESHSRCAIDAKSDAIPPVRNRISTRTSAAKAPRRRAGCATPGGRRGSTRLEEACDGGRRHRCRAPGLDRLGRDRLLLREHPALAARHDADPRRVLPQLQPHRRQHAATSSTSATGLWERASATPATTISGNSTLRSTSAPVARTATAPPARNAATTSPSTSTATPHSHDHISLRTSSPGARPSRA